MNKNTKKLIAKIIAILLSICVVIFGTIFTVKYIKNNVGDTVLYFENQTALKGDVVKLPLYVNKNHGIWGGQLIIKYDASNFEFVSCANGNVFDECEINDNSGMVNIIVNQTELNNAIQNGLVLTLNFKIKETALKGDYNITFDTQTNFCDKDAETMDVVLKEGCISVK